MKLIKRKFVIAYNNLEDKKYRLEKIKLAYDNRSTEVRESGKRGLREIKEFIDTSPTAEKLWDFVKGNSKYNVRKNKM